MKGTHLGLSIVVALTACSGGPASDAYGPLPGNYRQIVADAMKADFFDPYSLRDVFIAEPYQGRIIFTYGWVVCVRANGKNRFGAYTGLDEFGHLIRDGAVAKTGDQANCPTAKYAPWPEIEMAGPGPGVAAALPPPPANTGPLALVAMPSTPTFAAIASLGDRVGYPIVQVRPDSPRG